MTLTLWQDVLDHVDHLDQRFLTAFAGSGHHQCASAQARGWYQRSTTNTGDVAVDLIGHSSPPETNTPFLWGVRFSTQMMHLTWPGPV